VASRMNWRHAWPASADKENIVNPIMIYRWNRLLLPMSKPKTMAIRWLKTFRYLNLHCKNKTLRYEPRAIALKSWPVTDQDTFFITLCATICSADSWVAIETFGKAKNAWFTEVVSLKKGIPSHDTFGYVFSVIDTEKFSRCFSRWVSDLSRLSGGEVISIDGECLRRSMDTASNKGAIYMVSAWASLNHLVLGFFNQTVFLRIAILFTLSLLQSACGGSGDSPVAVNHPPTGQRNRRGFSD